LKQSVEGFDSLTAPLYGCPVVNVNNGTCQGGISGKNVGFQRDIRPISGTNFVPRMSLGGELSIIMPIVNAPFRIYYAYNPLRLYETPYCNDVIAGGKQGSCSAELIRRPLHLPRAPQNLPPHRLHYLLTVVTIHRGPKGRSHRAALHLFRLPRASCRAGLSVRARL
jgi:hypothetical protein